MSTQSTQESADQTQELHGGRLIARRLKAHGVSKLFTLSGGHLFSIYDGCREEGIEIVDVRHEQTAAFAAEGWAKVTREPGVCALTAGPGVTNGMSAMASAQANHTPMLVLGGRAPDDALGARVAAGDRPRAVRASAVQARHDRPEHRGDSRAWWTKRLRARLAPHGGPTFLDFPLDYVFMSAPEPDATAARAGHGPHGADAQAIERAARLLREAERPVVMAGTDLYWGHGEHALLELAETLRIPVFLNGLARGCVPADHELFFSRTRSQALKDADVALVIGVPMDFRLGFGGSFGEDTAIVAIDVAEPAAPPSARAGGRAVRRARTRRSTICAPRPAARRLQARCGLPTCAPPRASGARRARRALRRIALRYTRCGSTRSWHRCSTATRS